MQHMHAVTGNTHVPADVRRKCRDVEQRCPGIRAYINAINNRILFAYGEPIGGPLCMHVDQIARWDSGGVETTDNAVEFIRLGLKSATEKEAERIKMEKGEKADEQESRQRVYDGLSKEAGNYADFLDRRRRGTMKVSA